MTIINCSNGENGVDASFELAEKTKEEANVYFKNQDYQQAIELYTKAIDLNGSSAIYYANRSFAYLKTECFGYAVLDATRAIEIDKNNVKGYYRRASAYMALNKPKLALRDYELVTRFRPNDKDAKIKYDECSKIVKRQAFEKAISVDSLQRSVADSIDLDTIVVEDSYDGPRIAEEGITPKFMEDLMKHFKEQKRLHRRYAYKILLDIKEYFMAKPSLIDVSIPESSKFTVCGDIHGQFYDLLNIFDLNGVPSESNPYLFNGDFVDRGSFSVECIFVLFGFKLLYPDHFFMARGNHESKTMNQMYGFEGEVKAKYNAQMAELFTEVYNWLPLCHCLNGRVLVMHGGLFSKDGVKLDDIRKIDRNRQPPDEGGNQIRQPPDECKSVSVPQQDNTAIVEIYLFETIVSSGFSHGYQNQQPPAKGGYQIRQPSDESKPISATLQGNLAIVEILYLVESGVSSVSLQAYSHMAVKINTHLPKSGVYQIRQPSDESKPISATLQGNLAIVEILYLVESGVSSVSLQAYSHMAVKINTHLPKASHMAVKINSHLPKVRLYS
ncbi:hypothetical protein QYM36_011140 [Artemia franciscana]|uniref:protein-serine/threonine phosphatase n=1 Tax=Artemia franciscana TaxID=6661 RepID=A0AA88L8Q7_ARTSF|nr:hypothetical protein QYM36_011140 [Artemia franciscana]